MKRIIKSLNRDWQYRADFQDAYISTDFSIGDGWEPASLPHTNIELPFNNFDESFYQFVSTYRRQIEVPALGNGERIILHFEGVMAEAKVWINGQEAGNHKGGYTPFDLDVTSLVEPESLAHLVVRVDSREREDIPPFGNVVDYLTYGGIYREVQLLVVPPVFVQNVFLRPQIHEGGGGCLEASVRLCNRGMTAVSKQVKLELKDASDTLVGWCEGSVEADCGETVLELALDVLPKIELWDLDSPVLYWGHVALFDGEEKEDAVVERCGFRTAEFTDKGFFLNGKKVNLRGLNRHQSYPYVGYAMPKGEQRFEADRLKKNLGLNLVRTSHYPQSRHFLDRCDEIGLLVFEEIPGWQHIGDEDWKDLSVLHVQEMVERDRNRPSVILWGVRINESGDDHDFYHETNRLAHELDPTRQTGGVRCFEKSELLEDVYTMNDFIHSGERGILRSRRKVTGKSHVPYLVTEHNGHMFPTKRFDQEQRLVEHALRHLRVLNQAIGDEQMSGAIGWCAWDYNTHREFGSGDRICYHGVADMFRVPKYAGHAYASQMSVDERVVLEPASVFAKGERDASQILPMVVFTNCESIVVHKNGRLIDEFFPDSVNFPHLEHPPIVIDDLVGRQVDELPYSARDKKRLREAMSLVMKSGLGALRLKHYLQMVSFLARKRMKFSELEELFMRYDLPWGGPEDIFEIRGMVKGVEVARRTYASGWGEILRAQADRDEMHCGDWDAVRVEFRVEDAQGNLMPFSQEVLNFEVEGPGEVMGPKSVPLTGGVAACWVRSHGSEGCIQVRGVTARYRSNAVTLSVK
ncbi:MAG: glycoside hydrolase family 2 protein [Spirochaetales bacterium]|nr:glycoside hydrolase family 2 protein [Spirochaetales bacterium]